MVQVLPAVPSFGERLAPVLAQGIANLGEGYRQYKSKKNDDMLWKQLQNPEIQNKPLDLIGVISKFSPERRKSLETLYGGILEQQEKSRLENSAINNYAAQFEGGMPQQEGDSENIKPSTSSPATDTISPNAPSQESNRALKEKLRKDASRSGAVGKFAKSKLEEIEHQEELALEKSRPEREYEFKALEKEQLPFFEQIGQDRERIPSALQSNQQVLDAIISGNVGPGSLPHIGKILNSVGVPDSITKLLESTDSKEFNNGIKALLGHTLKDTFRGTTTQREISIGEAMQAEVGVNKNANLAAAWGVQADLKIKEERLRLYDKFIEEGKPRSKIPALIDKELKPYRQKLSDQYFEAINELRKRG